jgi:hypothetical protein
MDSVSLLRQMIKVSAQVALEVRGEKASVELCEPQAPDSTLRIRGIPADNRLPDPRSAAQLQEHRHL